MMAQTGGGGGQEEVKKASNDCTRIIVKGIDGKKMGYNLQRNIRMEQVMKAYCDKCAIPFDSIALLFNGSIINEERTVDDLNIKDGDHIDVMRVQTGEMSLTTIENVPRAALKERVDTFLTEKAKAATDEEATKTKLLMGLSHQETSHKRARHDDDIDTSKIVMPPISDDNNCQMHHDNIARGLHGISPPIDSFYEKEKSDHIIDVARRCAETVDMTFQYAKRIYGKYENQHAIDKRIIAELEKKLKEANEEKMEAIAKKFEAKMEVEEANNKLKELEMKVKKHNDLKTIFKVNVKKLNDMIELVNDN